MLRPLTEYEACLQEERNHQWAVSKGAPSLSAKLPVHPQTCHLQYQQQPRPLLANDTLLFHDLALATVLLFTPISHFQVSGGIYISPQQFSFTQIVIQFWF